MAQSDFQIFLYDMFARYDPTIDLTEGSAAYTKLIEPLLQRVGPDPFDEDINVFIRTRLQQACPNLAISDVDELTDLLVDPMRILIEPVAREVQLVKLRTSLANAGALSDAEIDALMANFFEPRRQGGYAVGVVRAYFANPQSVTVTMTHIAQTGGALRFLVTAPQTISAAQMLLNVSGSEYYFDINYIAESRGDEYNIGPNEITSISNLAACTRATNLRRFESGVAREDNDTYVARVEQGASDKTLTTDPGIVGVLSSAFPSLRTVFSIGMGDPEMQRDVIKGGGLGAIPSSDALGEFYGFGTPTDDGDADATTPLLECTNGNFITRVGAVGLPLDGWYMTVVYQAGSLVVRDSQILAVVSDTRVRLADEIPVTVSANAVTWMLRPRRVTISDIPGGITFPDTPEGTLELPSGSVHIGGKTDVFVAGPVEQASAQIVGLSDEKPLARGVAAQTQGSTSGSEDTVLLPDVDLDLFALATSGMSLVLSEGADVGAYRIIEVLGSPARVRLDTLLTGTQANLAWKIVDEIDVDLLTPKDILLEGNDLILSGNSSTAIVSGSVNFAGAGVQPGDILFVDNLDYGGDFTITEATATALTISPPAPRAISGVHYTISRRSAGVELPLLRVSGLELLDSAGAPNGTVIPYRDPVLTTSNAFQNEGTGYLYDGPAILGLVSTPLPSIAAAIRFTTLIWKVQDPKRGYAPVIASGTYTFSTTYASLAALVTALNADPDLNAAGVRAVVLTYAGNQYLGFTSTYLVTITGGTGLPYLGLTAGATNTLIRTATNLAAFKVRRGDLVECVGGSNGGLGVRVITDPTAAGIRTGTGPLGPANTVALYDVAVLNPDVAGRIRVGRPSVGSVRCYFLDPTSVDFRYATTRFQTALNGVELAYLPDPENTRILVPPPPTATLPGDAVAQTGSITDTTTNFLRYGIQQGDLLELLYRPITSTVTFDPNATVALTGKSLILQLDNDPFIEINFPYAMTLADAVAYINAQVGTTIATAISNQLVLSASRRIGVIASSTALALLGLASWGSNDHPNAGTYIVQSVTSTQLYVSASTPLTVSGTVPKTQYRISRYLQRVSSTEMALNVDASGLYYADVQAISLLPGDVNNIGTGVELTAAGYASDGYRLISDRPELSYSRAEDLRAELSRTILLPGASDNPMDYVQLNLQNVQVRYDRSALADDIQSFCASRYRRVVVEDILVRHLLPHYVSIDWRYVGGVTEPVMTRALTDFLYAIEAGGELEVGAMVQKVRAKGASSVFAADSTSTTGRAAPFALVIKHDEKRKITASLVRDVVSTVRMCTYLPDQITVRRVSTSGLR